MKAAIRKAAVLPVPVCDWPATSLPLRARGSVPSWMGVMATKPYVSGGAYKNGAGRGQRREWNWVLGVASYYAVPTLGPVYAEPWDFTTVGPRPE